MFLHFLHRQNNRAYIFEVKDDKIDLDYFCLKMPFFVFSSHVGCPCGSHPQRAWAPCGLWCTNSNNTPVKKRHAWVDEEQRPRHKKQLSQGYVPHHAVSSWTSSSKESFSVLSLPLKFSLGLFHLKKMIYIYSRFLFPDSVCNRPCTDGAEWAQCKQIPVLHGYHTWPRHGLEQ